MRERAHLSGGSLRITSTTDQGTTGSPDSPDTLIAEKLTEREIDVLRLLDKGLINQETAEQQHLSTGTVSNHVSVVFTELEVQDRTQAAIIAIRYGLAD
jgi:NarL family two-component system response regulator LiaR